MPKYIIREVGYFPHRLKYNRCKLSRNNEGLSMIKLYFSTKSIPKLSHLPLTERLEKMQQAQGKLQKPEVWFLNLLKLIILVPIFIFILQVNDNWLAIGWAILVALIYPLLLRPFQYGLCAKYIQD